MHPHLHVVRLTARTEREAGFGVESLLRAALLAPRAVFFVISAGPGVGAMREEVAEEKWAKTMKLDTNSRASVSATFSLFLRGAKARSLSQHREEKLTIQISNLLAFGESSPSWVLLLRVPAIETWLTDSH